MSRVPIRIDPGRRAAAAVGLAVLAAAVLTGVWVVAARPRAVSVSASAPQLPGATSPAGTEPAASGGAALSVTSAAPVASPSLVVVDVAGKVRRPGLYHLPAGARVDDAVRAAGGPLGRVDLSSLNLAAKVVDGEQILVGGGLGAAVAANPASAPGAGAVTGSGPVNLNSASLEQLEALPGIGPVLAQHVLEWRSAHGGFASVDQLNDVTGIGDVKFAGLRGLVTV
jgi:competence protein ComEA